MLTVLGLDEIATMSSPGSSGNLPLVRQLLPALPEERLALLAELLALIRWWNERVNLVSRRDIDQLELHHLVHSLMIARVWEPEPGATAIDIGTGGGFPGLPLAILFPQCQFTLVDSVGKKVRAIEDIAARLDLPNVHTLARRAEQISEIFDYAFGRAVAALPTFLGWAGPLLRPGAAGNLHNGALYFKGTLYESELADSPYRQAQVWTLHEMFPDPFFAEKFLLHFVAPLPRPAPR